MELDAQCTKQQDLSAHTAVVKRTGGLPQHLSIKIQSCPALNSVLLCTGHGMGLWNMKKSGFLPILSLLLHSGARDWDPFLKTRFVKQFARVSTRL